jgi:small-conductance mechanosensitive channel/CRP-like cAMP-binding protein
MNVDAQLLAAVIQAAGLGLAISLILWLLRRYDFTRRVWLSVLGVAIAIGLRLVLRAAGLSQDELSFQVLTAIAILLAANAGLQLIDRVVWDYLLGRARRIVVPRLLVDLFNVLVLVGVALLILDRVFEVDLTAVLVTSTVVSAIIGLSLQDTLGNVIAGLALQLDRPLTVGDWVQISGQDGEVMQMNWRTIMLRSIDNHWFVIPNANVARHDIINYSRPTVLQRLHVKVGLSYRNPPGKVRQVLQQAVVQAKGVRADLAPDALILEYGESAIIYDVRYWIDDFSRNAEIRNTVLTQIWYALDREGMSIPFPIRDVNLRQVPEDHERRLKEQLRQEIFASLRPLTVFAPLSDEQIERLAQHARVHRYTTGELLVRQGDRGDSLFVMKSGKARVDVRGENRRITTVAMVECDDFFGEMSLLTGEHRSASVIAESEVEVIVVDKSALARVLAADMEALKGLSQVVEQRFQDSAQKVAAAAADEDGQEQDQATNLLSRIQGFLGLK